MRLYIIIINFFFFIGCINNSKNILIEKANEIHKRVITLDTHNDIDVKNFSDSINYKSNTDTQVNLPKMIKGGLDVSWLIVYTKQGTLDDKGYLIAEQNAYSKFNAINRLTSIYAPDQIEIARSSKEVREIINKGKKVAMIGVENAYPLGLDTSNVKKFYDMGARYMSLAHNCHNQF